MMEINTLRIITTIVSFILFIGIVVWTLQPKNKSAFTDAANLPFTDDQS